MWRYSSLTDAWQLLKATVLSSLLVITAGLFIHRFEGYSRGVFVIDGVLTLLFTGGYRLLIRVLHNRGYLDKVKWISSSSSEIGKVKEKRVVLVGAGDAGEKTYREIRDNPRMGYKVVAFVDDDPRKSGFLIHGIPIEGPVSELPNIIDKLKVQEILITMPSATGAQMRRIVDACKETTLPYKTLPGLGEIIDGKISIKALRDVNYNDLLGREEVRLDSEAIRGYIRGKCVFVTGAGGSIGSELCRQIIKFNPKALILLDCSEANLYTIQMELKHKLKYSDFVPILSNIQNAGSIKTFVNKYKPDVIVHAAAKKHVPLMEENPWEAVFNNIIGTWNVMEAAIENRTKRFILVSTD